MFDQEQITISSELFLTMYEQYISYGNFLVNLGYWFLLLGVPFAIVLFAGSVSSLILSRLNIKSKNHATFYGSDELYNMLLTSSVIIFIISFIVGLPCIFTGIQYVKNPTTKILESDSWQNLVIEPTNARVINKVMEELSEDGILLNK